MYIIRMTQDIENGEIYTLFHGGTYTRESVSLMHSDKDLIRLAEKLQAVIFAENMGTGRQTILIDGRKTA